MNEIDVMLNELMVLTLASITVCGVLDWPTLTVPKSRIAGESSALVPVPLTLICCEALPAPLSLTLAVPEIVPDLVGVKVTLIVQLAPAATLDPQLFV